MTNARREIWADVIQELRDWSNTDNYGYEVAARALDALEPSAPEGGRR